MVIALELYSHDRFKRLDLQDPFETFIFNFYPFF
jgi:hypothetical protein